MGTDGPTGGVEAPEQRTVMRPLPYRVMFYLTISLFLLAAVDIAADTPFLFANHRANIVAGMVLMLMPTVAGIAGVPIAQRRARVGVAVVLWAVAALGLMVAGATLFFGPLLDWWPPVRTTVSTGRYTVAIYQDAGGATGEGGGAVFQVCPLVPGFVFSRRIYTRSRGPDVRVSVEGPDRVRVDQSTVILKPVGWFACR